MHQGGEGAVDFIGGQLCAGDEVTADEGSEAAEDVEDLGFVGGHMGFQSWRVLGRMLKAHQLRNIRQEGAVRGY